jgi:hypothetical protein
VPFKSKSQARKMFALEARNELPKGTARHWARETKSMKSLPEKVKDHEKKSFYVKMAYNMGQLRAMEKVAISPRAVAAAARAAKAGTKAAPASLSVLEGFGPFARSMMRYGGPAALGAYLAGPGYRGEGAMLGLTGAALSPGILRTLGERASRGGEWSKSILGSGHPENVNLATRLIAGGGAGYLGGRMLGAQNPYGMQPVFQGAGKENPMGLRPEYT